jgi:hypothetical protein
MENLNQNTNIVTEQKTGHDFLRELCAFNADFNAFQPQINPITNRVQYIIHQLTILNIEHEVDMFDTKNVHTCTETENKFVNINVFIKGNNTQGQDKTIVFLAHHDVANIESENAQDNTASVCNLIDLCIKVKSKAQKGELNNNVLIVFTDAEEIVSFTNSGATRLANRIKKGDFGNVEGTINLELSGLGQNLWATAYSNCQLLNTCISVGATYKLTPFSDTATLFRNGVPNSVCIGILPNDEIDTEVNKNSFPKTWMLCHSKTDTFDKTNKEDMTWFVDTVLLGFIS